MVGEETNKLMGYLAATSRKLERPLAVVVQSQLRGGQVGADGGGAWPMPDEEQVKYSAMTGQSLFYMGETNLSHKILAIVEEEGAERASYALKLLQSEGELTIASTGKDPSTGRLVTHEYRVEGPVMIFLTTTAIDIDEELLNRCLVLSVDEAREQTRAIHRLQRERRTLEGLLAGKRREAIVALHQNAQRLLRPLAVVNPYAPELTFLDTADPHPPRPREVPDADRRDRALAPAPAAGEARLGGRAAGRVHRGRARRHRDRQPPGARGPGPLARRAAAADAARCWRCSTSWCPPSASGSRWSAATSASRGGRCARRPAGATTQVRMHLARLVALEYVLVHQGGRGQSFVYELLYEGGGEDGAPVLPGLIDVAKLRAGRVRREVWGPRRRPWGAARPSLGGHWTPIDPHWRGVGK